MYENLYPARLKRKRHSRHEGSAKAMRRLGELESSICLQGTCGVCTKPKNNREGIMPHIAVY